MSTSLIQSFISEIQGDKPLSQGTLAYFRERQRNRIHELVLQEFLKSGLNKAEFARRIGRAPEQITRWLAAPGNWELDTISDFLLGTSGAEFDPSISHPLDVPAADHAGPDWLVTSDHNHRYNIDITTIGIYGALCLDPIPFDRLAPRAEDALAEQEWTANDNNKPSALSQAEAYKQRRTSSALAG